MTSVMPSGAPTCAAAVANAFLDIQAGDNSQYPLIDQMKLQKLVFYAQAWWLAYTGQELFPDDVEAWPWGPVVRSIYGDFKSCGRDAIEGRRATVLQPFDDGSLKIKFAEPPPPPPEVMTFLRDIWEQHKPLTGIQLSNITHLPGEPWTIIKDQVGDLSEKPRIPNTLIRDVFRKKLGPQNS